MSKPAHLQLHPWNAAFTWTDHGGPLWALTQAQGYRFDRDGFLVLSDVVERDLLGRVEAELDRYESEVDATLARHGRSAISESGAITFSEHLVVHSPLLRSLAAHPTIVGLCHDLIGPSVRLYWDQAVYKKPEKPRRFPWHQDNGYTYVEPQHYLTCWLAVNDATTENGCPWVVPGVHRQGTLAHSFVEPLGFECFADHPDKMPIPVRAGAAVVFSSLTPHLTGPNTTQEVRKAYILQYAPDGAETLAGDPATGGPVSRRRCDARDRQFPVLSDGRRVPTV